jgi:hypothetical protein
MLTIKGTLYALRPDGLYMSVVFVPVPGGAMMKVGLPQTLEQILGRTEEGECDAAALKGAALLKQWDEEVDHD